MDLKARIADRSARIGVVEQRVADRGRLRPGSDLGARIRPNDRLLRLGTRHHLLARAQHLLELTLGEVAPLHEDGAQSCRHGDVVSASLRHKFDDQRPREFRVCGEGQRQRRDPALE